MQKVIWKGTFKEAEDKEMEYYASVDWKKNASTVEQMRKMFWKNEYELNKAVEVIIRKVNLQEITDDFE